MFEPLKEVVTEKQFIEKEIIKWLESAERRNMLVGQRYYRGEHDILNRKKTVVCADGSRAAVPLLRNHKMVDNQYLKAVNQKVNYLFGKPFVLETDNPEFTKIINGIISKKFRNLVKNVGVDVLNNGIGWIGLFYDENGEFKIKRFDAYEILPFWKNSEHSELDMAVRLYQKETYVSDRSAVLNFVEVYKKDGVERYRFNNSRLEPEEDFFMPYITDGKDNFSWGEIPLIPFKYDRLEIPLIVRVKSLQDALNELISDFHNNMSEDVHSTVLVLKNYEGENLGEFRHNLATYGAVKVRSVDGREGGIETLKIDVNSDNYSVIISLLKQAIIENAMSFDAKDQRISGNPNQMNLLSMYSDIELDANNMELEFQESLERFFSFLKIHILENLGFDFRKERAEILFNRDMLMNESDIISNLIKSKELLSKETLIAQHPWVSDVEKELWKLEMEREVLNV